MATTPITINIDSTLIAEAVDALCKHGSYQAQIQDPANPEQTIANPMTKAQFAKLQVKEFIRNVVKEQRNRALLETDTNVDPALIS